MRTSTACARDADLTTSLPPALLLATLVIGAAALVLALALEWRRGTPRRALRLCAAAVAVLALVALVLRPAREHSAPAAGLLVITPGASDAGVAAARRTSGLGREVRVPLRAADEARLLATALAAPPLVQRIHVVGWGLTPAGWGVVRGLDVTAEPAAGPDGIADVRSALSVTAGAALTVDGRLVRPARDSTTIVLTAPDGTRDSVRIAPGARGFRLVTRPRAPGAWTYALGIARSALPAESLHVDVHAHRPIGVLLLADAPDFELTALRRWLERRGERIVARTRVSKERFATDAVNVPAPKGPWRLDAESLRDVQLVVADPGAIAALPPAERAALRAAIRDDGLGVLLLGASDAAAEALGTGSVPAAAAREAAEEELVRPRVPGMPGGVRTLLPLTAVAWRVTGSDSILARDESGAPLAVARAAGRGMIAVTAVAASTRWMLAGEQAAYDAYWGALTSALAGPGRAGTPWRLVGGEDAEQDVPATLARETGDSAGIAVVVAPSGRADTLAPVRVPGDSVRLQARWWPTEAGWHRVERGHDETRIFVRGSAYPAPREAARRLEALAAERRVAPGRDGGPRIPVRGPLSPLWWLGLFVAAAGALWLLQRRDG